MSTEPISIDRIHRDPAIQSRVTLNPETVADYAETIKEWHHRKPITLFHESGSGKLWLADGWHRVAAAEKAGMPHIMADIKPGGRRETLLCSVGANVEHGLRRTNADKRRAVELLLKDPELVKMSDRDIARYCYVSHNFVGDVRRDLEQAGVIGLQQERTGADGKTYTVPAVPAANGSEQMEQQLGGKGARVRARNGTEGVLLRCEGRTAYVETQDGIKELDALYLKRVEEKSATPRLTEATIRERFPLDTKVRIEGGDLVGVVSDIGGVYRGQDGKVCVTMSNGDLRWVDAAKVTVVEDDPPGLTPAEVEQMDADLAADMERLAHESVENPPVKSKPAEGVAEMATVARIPAFADGALVKTPKGRVGKVIRTAWYELLGERCHLEFPPEGGDKRPSYYWYDPAELVAVESAQINGAVGAQPDAASVLKKEHEPGCPHPDHACTCDIMPEQVTNSDDPVVDEWAGDTDGVGESEQTFDIEHQAPRPWQVDYNRPNNLCRLRSATGRYVASVTNALDDTEFLADFIAAAVNAHVEYSDSSVQRITQLLGLILEYADGQRAATDLNKETFRMVNEWLYRTEMKHFDERYPRQQPQPEAAAP